MGADPSDIVSFGLECHYKRSTRTIIVISDKGERSIERSSYMKKIQGKLRFSDSELALKMFASEFEKHVSEIRNLEPGLIAVQIVLPLIELVGKICRAGNDGENFRYGAKKLFPRESIEPQPIDSEYNAIIGCLWDGLRCGLLHSGFMQDKSGKNIDLQILGGNSSAPSITFSQIYPEAWVVQLGAKSFIETVIGGVKGMIEELRGDASKREDRFLPLWQNRWGFYQS